jgi:hypothetical protein
LLQATEQKSVEKTQARGTYPAAVEQLTVEMMIHTHALDNPYPVCSWVLHALQIFTYLPGIIWMARLRGEKTVRP